MSEVINDVIAVRRFETAAGGEVRVIVGKPQAFPDSGYYCPYQIVGIGKGTVRKIGGVDAIQALQLVMKVVGTELAALNDKAGGVLRWEHGEGQDFGF